MPCRRPGLLNDALKRRRVRGNGLHHHIAYVTSAGLHATEHAAIALLPLFALCDRNDIGGLSTPAHPDTGNPQIFIYDAYTGGIGTLPRRATS